MVWVNAVSQPAKGDDVAEHEGVSLSTR